MIDKEEPMKKALVLGGTAPHINLIENLKRRGYEVILLDYLENPPAAKAADVHVRKSTLDLDEVLRTARDESVDLVISSCVDQANATACFVAENLGLPMPYSYETALNVTDKLRMKRLMVEGSVPTSRFVEAPNIIERAIEELTFPLVVKPVDSNGSRGIHRVDDDCTLRAAIKLAEEASRSSRIIVEEFVTGVEVSYYFYIQDGKAFYLTSNQRLNFETTSELVLQCSGALYPADISPSAHKALLRAGQAIADSFGLINTPMFLQAKVDKDEVSVIEFAPRVGGGLSFRNILRNVGFDIIDASVCSFLGERVDLAVVNREGVSLTSSIYAKPGIFEKFEGISDAVQQGFVDEFYPYKTPGAEISSEGSSGSRVGGMLISGTSKMDVFNKDLVARKMIRVFDAKGEDITFSRR